MIPILAESNTSQKKALGRLTDAISCHVVEERNGIYELEMEYPTNGALYEELHHSCMIKVIPCDGGTLQGFRIYKITRPINGRVMVYARHISYQLNHIPVFPFTARNASEAMANLKTYSSEDCPFTFWTDKTNSGLYNQNVPESIRARLGGTDGSILDTYGGELEWDNYSVKLHKSRGANRGVQIRYGKNITDITQEENIESTITGIAPYWFNDGELVTLPEKARYASETARFPYQRVVTMDFTDAFENKPTVEALRTYTNNYIASHKIGIPSINLEVSFILLGDTLEYLDIVHEEVRLCDTVTVIFEGLGIETTAKVSKTDYNVLLERYNSVQIGDLKRNFGELVANIPTYKKGGKIPVTPELLEDEMDLPVRG